MQQRQLERFELPRDALHYAWERYADQPALIFGSETITYAKMQERVLQLGNSLRATSLRPGSVCLVSLESTVDMIIATQAAMETGTIIAPIPRHSDVPMLERLVAMIKASSFLHDAAAADNAARLRRLIPNITLLRIDGRTAGSALAGTQSSDFSPRDSALISFTAGTTGIPKALHSRHAAQLACMQMMLRNFHLDRVVNPAVTLLGIPFAGAGSGLILPTLVEGGTLVIPAQYSADTLLDLIAAHGVDRLFVTPSLLIDILDHPARKSINLSSLRSIVYGTELMPAAKLEEALGVFGPILQQGYGCAEAPPPIAVLQAGDHWHQGRPADRETLSSCGTVVDEAKVIITDDDDREVNAGEIGNILIQSPTQFRGYLAAPANANHGQRDGWLNIGDLGYFDGQGRLHVLGRRADVIVRNGRVTYPRPVEEIAHDHPAIKETAYVQVRNRAILAVSLRQGWRTRRDDAALINELKKFIRARIPTADYFDDLVVFDELPRSALGKLLRREVRDQLAARPSLIPPQSAEAQSA